MTKKRRDPYAQREAKKYQNPIPSREYIYDYLNECGKARSYRQILNYLQLKNDEQHEALRRRLRAMVRDGQLIEAAKQKYTILKDSQLIKGHIEVHKEGFGYLIPSDGSDDLFLSARQMSQVFDGDLVLARPSRLDYRGRPEGIIIKVLDRAHQEIAGRYCVEANVGFIEPSNRRINKHIIIPDNKQKGAKDGEMVVAQIVAYPSFHSAAVGHISKILGDHMAAGMEVKMAMHAYQLPHQWPDKIQRDIKKFPLHPSEKDKHGRSDLRDLPFFTIDGEDAKDFDDAVYCQPSKKGWQLYVAIADVSHYVKANTALDDEAFNRGNSVYFPGEVIPMLPKALSNGLCSLKPKVERLCLVCEMKISQTGKLTDYDFYQAVIRSQARLSYNKVAAFFAGDDSSNSNDTTKRIVKKLHQPLLDLYDVYQALHQQRLSNDGMIFETTEIKIQFGAKRKIKQLLPMIRNDAHKLIEECMLQANIAAAKFLSKHHIPALYRVHTGPKKERLEDLRSFLAELELHLGGGHSPKPKHYAKILSKIENQPEQHLVQTMLLRSMSRAFYTPDNGGHFSLALKAYTHFTSPIRRYPDLLIHRAIKSVLDQRKKITADQNTLIAIGEHCSETARRADEATRDAISWLKCEYMLEKVGDVFDGVISSVTNFGLFVELDNIFVEGLVHVSSLTGDHYQFDVAHQRLRARNSDKIYRFGDQIKVQVVKVDLDQRRIDFHIVKKNNSCKKTIRQQQKKGRKPNKAPGNYRRNSYSKKVSGANSK